VAGILKECEIFMCVRLGSLLSPLLFIIVTDEVTRKIRKGVPWKLMFAGDLALTEERKHLKHRDVQ